MTRDVRGLAAALALALAATLAGCGSPPAKTGGAAAPVELRGYAPNVVAAETLSHLLGRHGSLRVVDVGSTLRFPPGDEDGGALTAVRDGSADIAVLRATNLADAGATALHALQVPFLVGSDALAAAVARDRVAADLLRSVEPLGLVGLALVPGGVRHPFAYGDQPPLLGPASYRGATINIRHSRDLDRLFAALGARTDSSADIERSRAAHDGRLQGIEVSYQQIAAVDFPATVTADVALYTKFDVVVVRRAAWDALPEVQRTTLRRAAADAALATLAARRPEAAGLTAFCRIVPGNRAVLAGPAAITALQAALAPAATAIEAAPGAHAAVERIRELARSVPARPAPVGACPEPAPVAFPAPEPVGDQRVIDGVWRVEARAAAMAAAGADAQYQRANAGTWTWTFGNGLARGVQPHGADCIAAYEIAGDRLVFDFADDPLSGCGERLAGTFSRSGSSLRFAFTAAHDIPDQVAWEQAIWAGGLSRIGGLPRAGQDVLDGTWRVRTTTAELEPFEPGDSAKDVGTWTFHLRGGTGTVDQPSRATCLIDYRIDGDRIAIGLEGRIESHCGGVVHGTWTRHGDLVTFDFRGTQGDLFDAFFRAGLRRVGAAG